jgi:hypothetical protein
MILRAASSKEPRADAVVLHFKKMQRPVQRSAVSMVKGVLKLVVDLTACNYRPKVRAPSATSLDAAPSGSACTR